MKVPNFYYSSLTFRIDFAKQTAITVSHKPPSTLNNVRIQLESRCIIKDSLMNISNEYVLGASCKTERVGVERDIWIEPNADFCPVFSDTELLIMKSWDKNNKGVMLYPPSLGPQPERQIGQLCDAYEATSIKLRMTEASALTREEIVNATLEGSLLNGRIEFEALERFEVLIDFPIKTMNVSERDWIYQTDTGPILFPDFSEPFDNVIETLKLAYVAYNCADWAEFIVQVPTSLMDEISVNHYSKSIRLDTKNKTFKLNDL